MVRKTKPDVVCYKGKRYRCLKRHGRGTPLDRVKIYLPDEKLSTWVRFSLVEVVK